MITDEERRNVAANIRSAANRCKNDLQDDPDYSPFAALYAVFCGVRGWPHYEDLLHLADLIDRGECEMAECSIDHGSCSWGMHCSRCGAEFEHEKPAYGWRYCPNCGAEVVVDEN